MKVKCPKCGRIGILREYPTHAGYKWKVWHGKDDSCLVVIGVLQSYHYYKRLASEGRLEKALEHIPARWHQTFKVLFLEGGI